LLPTVRPQVVAEVSAQLQTLRCRLFSAIVNSLDVSGTSGETASGSNGQATQQHTSAVDSRWSRVRERFLSIFTSSAATAEGHTCAAPADEGRRQWQEGRPAASAGASSTASGSSAAVRAAAAQAVARSRSRAELAALLAALHSELTVQIDADVRDFWATVEGIAASRHAELLAALNERLRCLAKQVWVRLCASIVVSQPGVLCGQARITGEGGVSRWHAKCVLDFSS
jgi:hypothetical protein